MFFWVAVYTFTCILILMSNAAANGTLSGAIYLGPCFESFEAADGSKSVQKLYAYMVRGERRFALSEEAARASATESSR